MGSSFVGRSMELQGQGSTTVCVVSYLGLVEPPCSIELAVGSKEYRNTWSLKQVFTI